MKNIFVMFLIICFPLFISSCGGGGGGGTSSSQTTGSVQGYVYIPYGSAPTRMVADTIGYKPYSGAAVKATCGSTVKNTTSGTNGLFKFSSLPVVSCTVETKITGYVTQTTQLTVKANQTVTVGGTDGVKMTPSTHGVISVSANISGGAITLDGDSTGIYIPTSLSYSFPYVKPGNHTVGMSKSGYESVTDQQVTVTAGNTSNVSFTLNPIGNHAPIANAGVDGKTFAAKYFTLQQQLNCNVNDYIPHDNYYLLDGSGSNDPDNNPLTYRWEQTSGTSVSLSNAAASKTTFVPTQTGTYTFKLIVNDGYLDSAPDNVNVSVAKISGKITFSSCQDIYTMNADGTNLQQLNNNNYYDAGPRWSPDGTKILYTSNPSRDEVTYFPTTMSSSGSNVNVLSTDTAGQDWSPDGQYILIKKKYNGYYELHRALPDGSGITRITTTGQNNSFAYYSSDGMKIAFVKNIGGDSYHIMVMNSDGSNLTQLTNDSLVHYNDNWTPDGRILFTNATCLGCNSTLYVMNADGTGKQAWPVPYGVNNVDLMAMTNDGDFIFYTDSSSKLHVMYSDGSADLNLGLYGIQVDYNPNP